MGAIPVDRPGILTVRMENGLVSSVTALKVTAVSSETIETSEIIVLCSSEIVHDKPSVNSILGRLVKGRLVKGRLIKGDR